MALLSPGVQVTIVDESQYIPAATNSVPYILLATAQNKVSGAGVGVAAGTLAANANKVYLMTSQRDLLATFGNPFFYTTTTGTPINGYELNEYGLLAAYSALGVSNRCYVQRVDIDLAELTATLVRPTGSPNNGTYWLDSASSQWGIFEWNQTTATFTHKIPRVITSTNDLEISSTVPLQSIGSIGDYAITATSIYNPEYYKRGGPTASQAPNWTEAGDLYNSWVLIGSNDWKTAWPTVQGSNTPVTLTATNTIILNGTPVAVPAGPDNTITGLAGAINSASIAGVYAANIDGKLSIYADSTATADGSTDGSIGLVEVSGTGTLLSDVGITAQLYHAPAYQHSYSYQTPRWRTTDTAPEPTGSVWQKENSVNLGMNIQVKKYNSTLGAFVLQSCPVYNGQSNANYQLDPSGGGKNIAAGTLFASSDPYNNATGGLQIWERFAAGPTIITGDTTTPGPFSIGDQFTIQATAPNTTTFNTGTATLTGTTVADFLAAVSAAGVPYVSASVNGAGAIVFTHSAGGIIGLVNTTNTPVDNAGFNTSVRGVTLTGVTGPGLILSNWVSSPTFEYIASNTAPDQDPANGRLWYYSATDQADIMIQNNGQWLGYQQVTNDVRGYNLSQTSPNGPIFATTAPPAATGQSDGTPLVYGDLWIDTSDLENYPLLNRWENVDGQDQWVRINNADQTTENGVLFADARWATNGNTNPITDPIPSIVSLLTSPYLDLDAPTPTLYPQGMLLFNTRRSGFNVKAFEVNYFNSTSFPGDSLPDQTNAWVTQSSTKFGRLAQRSLIVAALKSGIDTSVGAREEIAQFNLIACPQYPELIPNMAALNNERNNTAFTIGDTPLRLAPTEVVTWQSDNGGVGLSTGDGLVTYDPYVGVFYPSCQTTDLTGNVVVQPPSHMMIRTIIRSDEVSFPWFAPAGTQRGVIDNAVQIGYVNGMTGAFQSLGVNQALRDTLYQASINPITFIPGVGITNFGNKTTTSLTTALDRINVARLVAFIRARLESIGKQYLFQPNDQITRNEITNSVNSLMIDLVAKRGIYDYLVVCDLTNNTPARIDNNELWVDIAIEPVKAVEFVYIPVRIKNTGAIAAATIA